MEVKQKDDSLKGMFYIENEGVIIAQMSYTWAGTGRIIIDHTEVDEKLKGKGIGKQLVSKAVDFARETRIKIIPICSFAKRVFENTLEFNDVI